MNVNFFFQIVYVDIQLILEFKPSFGKNNPVFLKIP